MLWPDPFRRSFYPYVLKANDLLALFRKNTPGNVDADRCRNRFPIPPSLQPFQFRNCMVQLLVDHGFVAQQLVQFILWRQEEKSHLPGLVPDEPQLKIVSI